jgi:hypothetical protein
MPQITGDMASGQGIYWSNATTCPGAASGDGECKTPWWFLLALAASVMVGKAKKAAVRRGRK